MDEMDLPKLLESWGMSQILDKFQENLIDIDLLSSIHKRNDLLKELIPEIGIRMKFQSKLQEWIQCKEISEMTTGTNSQSSAPSSTRERNNEENPTVLAINDNTPVNFPLELNNISFDLSIFNESFSSFDLKTLLSTSALGKSVLKYYETYGKLLNTQQNRLVDIIIKHIYNYIVKSPLTHADYNRLTSKIIDLFPNEHLGSYYIPPVLKADSPLGRSQRAKGKLPNRVRNIRFLSGDTKKRGGNPSGSNSAKKKIKLDDPNIDQQTKEDWLWLKTNVEPWAVVIEKWQNTFDIRRANDKCTSKEFYEEWPILNDPRADILINLDFEKLYPHEALNFHLSQERFFQTIIEKYGTQLRDIYALELKENIKTNEGDNIPAILYLLNYIVPPTGKLIVGKSIWKFSTLESVEGMFLHIKEPGDIEGAINNKINIAYQKGRRVQPYIIFVGPSLLDIAQCFIVVDNIKYKFESCLRALDTLFKIFMVLNLEYPPESEHIYLIIQKGIYKITTPFDKRIPSIVDITES